MNFCAIATDDWIDAHLVRWIRYVKKYNPDAKLYLFHLGKSLSPDIRSEFEDVITLPNEGRPQWNRIRMSATTYFDVDEIVYLDADCDVIASLDGIPMAVDGSTLAFANSPAIHKDWLKICKDKGWDRDSEANNGLLYMSEDWGERYDDAVKAVAEYGNNPRIEGTIAFNWMLQDNDGWARLPYEYGVIWWDCENFKGAKVIQYCNRDGQEKRITMENEYRASRLPQVAKECDEPTKDASENT